MPQFFHGIEANHVCQSHIFDHIDPPFFALKVRYPWLCLTKRFGKVFLL